MTANWSGVLTVRGVGRLPLDCRIIAQAYCRIGHAFYMFNSMRNRESVSLHGRAAVRRKGCNVNKRLTFVLVSILMLALLLPACGSTSEEVPPTSTPIPSTPTLEIVELTYINAALGVSMWYPETWVYEEDQAMVTFGSSQEAVHAEDLETGAVFSVRGQDLEGDQVEDVVEMMSSSLGQARRWRSPIGSLALSAGMVGLSPASRGPP